MEALDVQRLRGGFRSPSGPPPPLGHRDLRVDPFPPLVFDWQEVFPYNLNIAGTSVESFASRILHGPLAIVQLGITANSSNSQNFAVHLGLADDDTAITTELDARGAVPGQSLSDGLGGSTHFFADTEPATYALNIVQRTGTTRVRLVVNNLNGTAVVFTGLVVVNHLRLAHCACDGN